MSENFAGQVLQKSGYTFAKQKIVSWCATLVDFNVPHKIQSAMIRRDGEKDGAARTFVAFVKLETARIAEQVSWYEQKAIIGRVATTAYLLQSA